MSQTKEKPKVVVIGGGTGLPVILRGLRREAVDVTAVVTVADDGGSSGIIRNYVNVVPPGDIRNVMAALSDLPKIDLDVFQYRFDSTDNFFGGHAIGNFIIAALSEMEHGIFPAVQELSKMMQINGHVYPAANEPLVLNAKFTDGTTLKGESEITAAHKQIEKVWVTSSPDDDGSKTRAVDEVIQAIMAADQIILGPGSLFTSILPNLMIANLGQAVYDSPAEVIYICNIMTQKGETDQLTDAQHVEVINNHLQDGIVDTVLVNTGRIPEDYMDYQRWTELSSPVVHDTKALEKLGVMVIPANFVELRDNGAFHNGSAVVRELMRRINSKQ